MKNKLTICWMKYGESIKMMMRGMKKAEVRMDSILFYRKPIRNGAKSFD